MPPWRGVALFVFMTVMQKPILYRAEGLDPIVSITDDGRLMATLEEVMLGWNFVPAVLQAAMPAEDMGEDTRHNAEPVIWIGQGEKGWTCSGENFKEPVTYKDPVATACSLIAAIYKAHTFADLEGLYMHAAGVRAGAGSDDGLILLIGHYRAGKSVVTTACAAAGLQVFSDDIIPLDPDGSIARAPGLAIRLRLPLPDVFATSTRKFIKTHRIAASKRYLYIRPPPNLLARSDETAPIRAVVSLRRTEGASAQLSRLAPGDALNEIIRRNFARELPAGRILDALGRLIDTVPCLSLAYDSAEDAAALLRDGFEDALHKAAPATPTSSGASKPARRTRLLADNAMIHRHHGAMARERDGQAFLTDAEEQIIFHLNPTGTAVWRLLEQPCQFGDLIATFAAAFPDSDTRELTADLSRLIRKLSGSGLVRIDEG
jgi:hypothetical protein